MCKTVTIAALGLTALALGACRQEPTAKPVDDGTEVTDQEEVTSGATNAADSPAIPAAAATPSQATDAAPTPSVSPSATPTP